MRILDQATQTVFADLNQRCIDAAFDADFPENGNFNRIKIDGKEYWYYNGYDPLTGTKKKKYVGPVTDREITSRVEEFGRIKDAYKTRLEAVRMLKAAGLPSPDALTGALLEKIAKAGFFRLRGVLVGTIAFQTYPGLVAARPQRHLQTGDIDLAQDHGISIALDDQVEPLITAIQAVDPSFRPKPNSNGPVPTSFVNAKGYQVEFLVPNRGSDDNIGHPTKMPALGVVAAEPLRYLDFLIRQPVRSVALHNAGVSVTVPTPERYAVHKIIVSTLRKDREKASKDSGQAAFLIEALEPYRHVDLADVWSEAWNRGAKWRDALARGMTNLPPDAAKALRRAIERSSKDLKLNPSELGFRGEA